MTHSWKYVSWRSCWDLEKDLTELKFWQKFNVIIWTIWKIKKFKSIGSKMGGGHGSPVSAHSGCDPPKKRDSQNEHGQNINICPWLPMPVPWVHIYKKDVGIWKIIIFVNLTGKKRPWNCVHNGFLACNFGKNPNFSNPYATSVETHPRNISTKFQDFCLGDFLKKVHKSCFRASRFEGFRVL